MENKLGGLENIWNRYQHKAQQCVWKANIDLGRNIVEIKNWKQYLIVSHGSLNSDNTKVILLFHGYYSYVMYILSKKIKWWMKLLDLFVVKTWKTEKRK